MATFVRASSHGCVSSIHLRMKQLDKVKVQGKMIDISPDAINEFYQLQNTRVNSFTGIDEYTAFIHSNYNVEEVMVELIGEPRNLLRNYIQKKSLTPKSRKLNLWIDARLQRASSHSLVSKR